MNYKTFLDHILAEAAGIADQYLGKVKSSVKPEDNNQVLTRADIDIGKYIVNEIKQSFPNDNIIDEEAGIINNNSEFTWVVDPVDGTSNFAVALPNFGIMVGLLDKDQPIVGGVSLPYYKEVYFAEKGKGASCNNKKINVTLENKLSNALVAYMIDGLQNNPDLTRQEAKLMAEIILKIRNLRTSGCVFDPMMLAKGIYGGVLCQTSKIWDNVAQHIIIEEAGGIYTDFFGKNIDYSDPLKRDKENFTFCAASPSLHKQLQEIIHVSEKI